MTQARLPLGRHCWVLILALGLALLLTLSLAAPLPVASAARQTETTQQPDIEPLPTGTDWDYQLGGARAVPADVGVVVRDRRAVPAPDRYNVCYVNGFQTQPDERDFWRKRRHLVLKRNGRPVVDSAWGEWLLDIRTDAKRRRLATIMGRWVERCAADGFAAVEFDNLDSFTRSHRLLARRHAVAFARLLVAAGHGAGLAVAQKNFVELDGTRLGFDFAIAESCGRYRECGGYVRHYGARVLVVEYRDRDFTRTCADFGSQLAVVRRDVALSRSGVRRWC